MEIIECKCSKRQMETSNTKDHFRLNANLVIHSESNKNSWKVTFTELAETNGVPCNKSVMSLYIGKTQGKVYMQTWHFLSVSLMYITYEHMYTNI